MITRLSLEPDEIEALPAEELVRWASAEFGERLCLTCSLEPGVAPETAPVRA